VETSFAVVEYLQAHGTSQVTEVADALDIAPSTAHTHLDTLYRLHYLVRDGDAYKLGFKFLDVGGYVATRTRWLRMTRSKVKQLAEETGERSQFIVEDHGLGTFVFQETGDQAVMTDVRIGKRVNLHTTAAGKAILAHLPRDCVETIIDQWGFPTPTSKTITDLDELWTNLETVRERGYAFNDGERIEKQRAVGVPVLDPNDRILGALSVSGPTHRLKGDWFRQDIPNLLLGLANEFELTIDFM
jgi:DNA-binding IclR family transcriptional regulator